MSRALQLSAPVAEKAVVIVQSSYIPWKGFFDLIDGVDELVLFDDVQFVKRSWRNRNAIKTPRGVQWLTIPVRVKGRYSQRIDEVEVVDPRWAEKHWRAITHNYAPTPYFDEFAPRFERLYAEAGEIERLSEINRRFIVAVCDVLGIDTAITSSTDYPSAGRRSERLISVCRLAGATHYRSGPSARAYLDESAFTAAGIEVSYMSYEGYPEYPQRFPPFEHHVSVLDLLFNTGPNARRYMRTAEARS